MRLSKNIIGMSVAATLVGAGVARAGVITQWNFNPGFAASPSVGAGTLSLTPSGAVAFGTNYTLGSPGDPAGATNNNFLGLSGPATTVASGTKGVNFAVNLTGDYGVQISFDLAIGSRASRYYQVLATTDGVSYNPLSGGTGLAPTTLGPASSATIDNAGLMTIVLGSSLTTLASSSFIYHFGYAFPSGSAVENNPNFGFRLVTIYDPNGTTYVSSQLGTTSTDTTGGYTTTSSLGGAMRLDYVNVTGVPEPTGLGIPAVAAGALLRRRRAAK